MAQLVRTHEAVEQLLDLLRCDHCNNPLHQPFTTGVCEHLICVNCRSLESSAKQSTCPVCQVPVHPRDFQQHPQISQLVLIARRLRRLTLPSDAQQLDGGQSELNAASDPTNAALSVSVPPAETESAPRIVLKRAYSSNKRQSTRRRPVSAEQSNSSDSVSRLSDSLLSCASAAPHPSVAIERIRVDQSSDENVECFKKPECSAVHRLPAYRRTPRSHTAGSEGAVHTPPPVDRDTGRMTRHSSKRTPCGDLNSASNVMPKAPIASPEDSVMTDKSHLSPEPSPPNPSTGKPTSKLRRFSERVRLSNRRKRSADSSTASKTSTRSSSAHVKPSDSFSRLVRKLRPNGKGESVLHLAAIRGNLEQILTHLKAGMSPNVRDHAGWTPLHEAVLHGHHEIAAALLEGGAVVDVPGGPELDTPLHDAVQSIQSKCCDLLLSHGANPLLANGAGLTPLQMIDIQLNRMAQISPKSKPKLAELNTKRMEAMESMHRIRGSLLKAISGSKPVQTSSNAGETGLATTAVTNCTFVERRRLRPVLLATGLNRQQQATFARVASMIHAQVVNSISAEVTHVITGASQEIPDLNRPFGRAKDKKPEDDAGGQKTTDLQATCPRTLKFLHAVLLGCWVLSFDWIETCAHVKMRVEEEGFEVTGCSTTPHSGAPRRARIAREAGSLGLFHGFRFCFLGEFVYPVPPRDDLVALARSGGASIVLSRDRCSAVRLARLALESAPDWDFVDTKSSTKMEEADDDDADADSEFGDLEKLVASPSHPADASSPLVVFYDPGHPTAHSRPPTGVPYAVQIVSEAASLIRPRKAVPQAADPPLRAVPSTWLLDSAAEYCILPFPSSE